MLLRARKIVILICLACVGTVFAASEHQDDMAALEKMLQSEVVARFYETSYAYAIFPTIGKGGIGIGAAHGTGRVYRNGKKLGDASMTQLSIGLQLGGQAYRQVIFFEDQRALQDFTSGNFEFGAQAEAIAITASAGAQAGTEGASASANEKQSDTAKFHKGMIVFTMGKGGLMYQASIGGQKYEFTPAN
jgi:lipid-binding SYLF domain-containing protein